MITCERCKAANLDGGQYCEECGAPLRPNSRSNPAVDASGVNLIKAEPEGQNGSHSPADVPQPEIVGRNPAHADRSFSAGRPSGPRKLVSCVQVSASSFYLLPRNLNRCGTPRRHLPRLYRDSDDPEAKCRVARPVTFNTEYVLEDLGSTNGTFSIAERDITGTRQP